jgi:hypothetical protein
VEFDLEWGIDPNTEVALTIGVDEGRNDRLHDMVHLPSEEGPVLPPSKKK